MDWDLLYYRVSQEQELANVFGPDKVACSKRVSAMVPEKAIHYEADACRSRKKDVEAGLDLSAYGGGAAEETAWLCQDVISAQGLVQEMCPARECSAVHGSSCSNWSFCSSPEGCGIGVPYGTCQLKASSEDPALGLSWSFDPSEPWTSGEPPTQ